MKPNKVTFKLSKEDKQTILDRLKAGETQTVIARDFDVTRQYVSMLYVKHFKPEQYAKTKEGQKGFKKRLTDEERESFIEQLKKTTPEEHGLIPHRQHWSIDHARQLAERLYDKTPSVRVLNEIVPPINKAKRKALGPDPKPQPPKPACIEQLEPEHAEDKEFVKYYLSEASQKIRWRTYEAALREWEKRNHGKTDSPAPIEHVAEDDDDDDFGMPDPAELKRLEKIIEHQPKKNKGSNFTPPKRRKRKKKK